MEIGDQIHKSMTPVSDAKRVELPAESKSSIYHYSYDSIKDLIV
jgi:hypothetical protein